MSLRSFRNHFFIDLTGRRVFCSCCKKACRSLQLIDFTLFWCATKQCENSEEVRLYRDGTWKVLAFTEQLQMNLVSEIGTETLLSIAPKCHMHQRYDELL